MAISKVQPMRQAEIDLIEEVNGLDLTGIESDISTLQSDITEIGNSISTLETFAERVTELIGNGFNENFTISDFMELMTEYETLQPSDVVTLLDTTNYSLYQTNFAKIGNFLIVDIGLQTVNAITAPMQINDVIQFASAYRPYYSFGYNIVAANENWGNWYVESSSGNVKIQVNNNVNANARIWLRTFYPIKPIS